jgi:hypothetical protein
MSKVPTFVHALDAKGTGRPAEPRIPGSAFLNVIMPDSVRIQPFLCQKEWTSKRFAEISKGSESAKGMQFASAVTGKERSQLIQVYWGLTMADVKALN